MLYAETSTVPGAAERPSLLLIHGWALNRHVWRTVVEYYQDRFSITAIDLPGHGKSSWEKGRAYTIDAVLGEFESVLSGPVIVLGWSLGAMLGLRLAATYPEKVKGLIAVAGTAQFTASDEWPLGVDRAVFDQFGQSLVKDYRFTIKRFLAVQALGSEFAKAEIRALNNTLFIDGEPDPSALQGGLDILQNTRLQASLASIHCPSLFISGANDTLVKQEASAATASLMNQAELKEVAGAGHAPFISHPDTFFAIVDAWLGQGFSQ